MGGIIGRFFPSSASRSSAAVLISMFVSFTLDPMLSSVWYDPQADGHGAFGAGRRAVNALRDGPSPADRAVLGWALAWPLHHAADRAADLRRQLLRLPRFIGFEFVPEADLGDPGLSTKRPSAPRWKTPRSGARSARRCARCRRSPTPRHRQQRPVRRARTRRSYIRLKPTAASGSARQRVRAADARAAGLDPGHHRHRSLCRAASAGGVQKSCRSRCRAPTSAVLDRLSQEAISRAPQAIPGLVDLDRNLKSAKPMLSVPPAPRRRLQPRPRHLRWSPSRCARCSPATRTSRCGARPMARTTTVSGPPAARRSDRAWPTCSASGSPPAPEPNGLAAYGAHRADRRRGERRRRPRRSTAATSIARSGSPPTPSGSSSGEVSAEPAEAAGRHQAAAGLPLRVRRRHQGHGRKHVGLCRPRRSLLAVILIYLILASQFGSFLQPHRVS